MTALSVSDAALVPVCDVFREQLGRFAGLRVPEPVVGPARPDGPVLRIECDPELRRAHGVPPTGGRRADNAEPDGEAHVIEVTDHGITVLAESAEAAHRALTTVVQFAGLTGGVPRGRTVDTPRFAWRGLSLDVVRRFLPPSEVRRVIDLLSLYKLNVLHLHLTDDEGWRLAIGSWPQLAEVGGAGALGDRPGGYYTQAEFRELVDYARSRFVTLVPEIDVPGHVGAVRSAHPEAVTVPPGQAAGSPHCYLTPDGDFTWRIVEDVFGEVADLTDAAYLHIGGDEAFGMPDADHAAFVSRVAATVRGLDRKVIGWQETARGDIGPDDVVQHWIDFAPDLAAIDVSTLPPDLAAVVGSFAAATGDLPRVAARGSGVLLSPTAHAYLDRPHGDPSTDPAQEALRSRLGLQFYPRTTLEEFATWVPSSYATELDPSAVVGVEAALWCETVEHPGDLDLLVLPRLAGVAQAAWGREGGATWDGLRERMNLHGALWDRAGWDYWRAASVFPPGG